MRHASFRIGEAERDAWLRHMRTALDDLRLDPKLDAQLWDYLVMAAGGLINSPENGGGEHQDPSAGTDLGLGIPPQTTNPPGAEPGYGAPQRSRWRAAQSLSFS